MVILYSFHDNLHLLYEIYDNLHLTSLLHIQTLDTHVLKMMENFLEKSYWAICLSEFVHLKGSSQKNKTKKLKTLTVRCYPTLYRVWSIKVILLIVSKKLSLPTECQYFCKLTSNKTEMNSHGDPIIYWQHANHLLVLDF